MDRKERIADLKGETLRYLYYLKDIGIDFLPLPPERREIKGMTEQRRSTSAATNTTPPASPAPGNLALLREALGECERCRLSEERNTIVFGVGNPKADIVFVGEGPGRDEDIKGEPFVGRAGQLLTKIIEAMGLTRNDVYICNVVKCRPPNNRNPRPDEIAACRPFLEKQLDTIGPKFIVALGSHAAQTLLDTEIRISDLRGRFHDYRNGIRLMPTYHPAYLLRNAGKKKETWEDMQQIMRELNLTGKGG